MKTAFFLLLLTVSLHAADIQGWSLESPRDEIRPQFSTGGQGSLIITHDQREGMAAFIEKRKAVFKK